MRLWRKLILCGAPLVLLAALPGSAPAQDALTPGGLHIQMHAGYETYGFNSYCLPVANWSLGRQAARGGNLEWQLASNYSTVPVFVKIEQRQAIAMTGRVEVTTHQPFHPAEAQGNHTLTVTKEFVAPPGRTTTVALAPRVAPQAAPGSAVTLTVRFHIGNNVQTQELRSTQLEPAHVYSLLLSDPDDLQPPLASTINEGNRRQIILPDFMVEGKAEPYVGLKTFNHYLLSIDRDTFTSLPLAPRDFAFVAVDAREAMQWTDEEQAALAQFAVAGGHLCLYNASQAKLHSLGDLRTRSFGRGWLIAAPGGLPAARAAMDDWLGGELEEISLWLHGAVSDRRLYRGGLVQGVNIYGDRSPRSQLMLDLEQLFARSNTSHEPGYVHPIWLYREACRPGAVEPWDFPEFNFAYKLSRPSTFARAREPMFQNWNLAAAVSRTAPLAVRPLYQLAQAPRFNDPVLFAAAGGVVAFLFAVCISARRLRLQLAAAAISLSLMLLLLVAWATTKPAVYGGAELTLVDRDSASEASVTRTLVATQAAESGLVTFPAGDLVRHIYTPREGSLDVSLPSRRSGTITFGTDTKFCTLATEAVVVGMSGTSLPVRVWTTRSQSETCVHVDTSRLPEGQVAVLYTPDGAEIIRAGISDKEHWLNRPATPIQPSADRLLRWNKHYSARARSFRTGRATRPAWQGAPEPLTALQVALTQPHTISASGPMGNLAWAGLLQTIGAANSVLGSQCYLIFEIPAEKPRSYRFMRLTLDLESGN